MSYAAEDLVPAASVHVDSARLKRPLVFRVQRLSLPSIPCFAAAQKGSNSRLWWEQMCAVPTIDIYGDDTATAPRRMQRLERHVGWRRRQLSRPDGTGGGTARRRRRR